jgi:hypothetical protein
MKKILSILLVLSLAFTASIHAQESKLLNLVAGDTLVLSSSSDTTSKTLSTTAGYSSFTLQVNLTKLSGTIAANSAKVYVYGSLDGANYTILDSSAAFTDITTNVAVFKYSPAYFTRYKVQVRPMGAITATYSAIPRFYYVAKLYDR